MSERRRRSTDLHPLVLLALGVCIVGVLVSLGFLVLRSRPAFQFTHRSYLPEQVSVCPGEPLTFHPTAIVREYPSVVDVVEEWQDTNGVAIIPGQPNAARQHSYEVETSLSQVYVHIVPLTLDHPGQYRLKATALLRGVQNVPAIVTVAFEIPARCFEKTP